MPRERADVGVERAFDFAILVKFIDADIIISFNAEPADDRPAGCSRQLVDLRLILFRYY